MKKAFVILAINVFAAVVAWEKSGNPLPVIFYCLGFFSALVAAYWVIKEQRKTEENE